MVGHFSMYYRRKHEPGRKGSHQLEDAGNQAIRTVYLLRTATLCFSLHASLEFRGGKVVDLAQNSPPCLRIVCFVSGWMGYYGITLPSHGPDSLAIVVGTTGISDLCHNNQFPSEKLKLELRYFNSVWIL